MPITKSAQKAHRASLVKKASNDRVKRNYKDSIKAVEKMAKTDKTEAKKLASKAQAIIYKATKKGVLNKNTASRKKALLSKVTKA